MGKAAHNRLNLVGAQFGILTVLALAEGRGGHNELLWLCRCACGNEIVRNTNKLRTGHTKSCGCLRRRSGVECPWADTRPLLDRLAERSHCDLSTDCLIWNGGRKPFGHGAVTILGRDVLVHRAAWIEQRGPIPDGIDCLHDCPGGDNPACWNVDHLWLGTQTDNNLDRDRKGVHLLLTPKGSDHGCAKLTDEQVIAIRSDTKSTSTRLSKFYGVSIGQICKIRKREAWSHIQ